MEHTLPASKTDPFRHGIWLLIPASNNEGCPVDVMKRLALIDTHRPPSAPLFCRGKHEQLAFTSEHVVQQLQGLAIKSGLGQGAWNGHCFRRGATTWAAEAGIHETQIQYKRFNEYSPEERVNLSQRFQGAVPVP